MRTRTITISMLVVLAGTFAPFAYGHGNFFGWTRNYTYNCWAILLNSSVATWAVWLWLAVLGPCAWMSRPFWRAEYKDSWKTAAALITVGAVAMGIVVLTEIIFARRTGPFVEVTFGVGPWLMLAGHLFASYSIWRAKPRATLVAPPSAS